MEKVDFLKSGKVYEFYQSYKNEKEAIDIYERTPSYKLDDLRELNNNLGVRGGLISITKEGEIHTWNSQELGVSIDPVLLDLYKESRKNKFTNLRFA